MKKFVLAAVAAAAAASFSGSALAVDLTLAAPVPDTFASELVTAGTTAVKTTTVTTDLGFGVSNTQTRFIRYDFTNSKIGAGGITVADIVVPNATVVVSSGGAAGGATVIFQITATNNIVQDADVVLTLTNGLVPTVLGPIDVTYRLYETAAAAVAGAGQLAQDTGTIIVFASGVALTAKQTTTTVDVNTSPTYTKFVAAAPIPTLTKAEIGKVSLGTANAKTPAGAPVTLASILGANSAITLTGSDLTAAIADAPGPTGLTLNAGGCAAAATTLGTSRTATSVSFLLPAVVVPIVDASLCFEVPAANLTPIAAQSFIADVAPGAVVGVPTPDVPAVAAGTFVRNGLVLKAAFAETTTAAGISSAAHLTNTTGNPAPFTVNCVLNTGSVAGTPGTLPAKTAQRFGLSSGLGCPTTGTLRGIEIIFGTTPGSVIGSIVRQNTTTGLATFDGMVGNQ